jgi:hypothetical protein
VPEQEHDVGSHGLRSQIYGEVLILLIRKRCEVEEHFLVTSSNPIRGGFNEGFFRCRNVGPKESLFDVHLARHSSTELKSGPKSLTQKWPGEEEIDVPVTFMFPRTQKYVGGVLYAESGVNTIAICATSNFIVSIRGVGKRNTLLEIEVCCFPISF